MTGPSRLRDAWGPTVVGGRAHRTLKRLLLAGGIAGATMVLVVAVAGFALYRVADSNLTRIPVENLAPAPEESHPLNVLLVGSDSRGALTEEQLRRYTLGPADVTDGQRSDTVILVSITPDQSGASVVSLPRDLLVTDDGQRRKLTETFAEGPEHLVEVVQQTLGVAVHHYVEASVLGFVTVVEAVGGVEVCLDEPLHDPKSGADLPAGCQELGPEQALAYVRSRVGARGDFERIERQQAFLRGVLDRLGETRMLIDVPRLFRTVERVAGNVTTDEELGLSQMRTLARELRGLADGRIPMTFLPGYTRSIDGRSYVVGYDPGVSALTESLREGRVLAPRGSAADRAGVRVLLWAGDPGRAATRVESTLHWSGFEVRPGGGDPPPAPARTTVYRRPGRERPASWVGATLGAPVVELPAEATVPAGYDAVVHVGARRSAGGSEVS